MEKMDPLQKPTSSPQPQTTANPPQDPVVNVTTPPAPSSPISPQTTKPAPNAGNIILEWLTYAFWGWTVLALSALTISVVMYYMYNADTSAFTPYGIASVLVLLPISIVCDIFYSRIEPDKKSGAALAVMVIHAVIFALLGIGSLIVAVFSVVTLLTNNSSEASRGTITTLISALIILIFYIATFLRTLNPVKWTSLRKIYIIFMGVFVGIMCVLGIIGPTMGEYKNRDDKLISNNISSITSSINSYVLKNNKLPESLDQLKLKGDQKQLIDRNLVIYNPNTYRDNTSSTNSSSIITPKKYTAPKYYYQLCVNYKNKSSGSNDSYYNYDYEDTDSSGVPSDYSTYISAYNHPAGEVCYKLVVTGNYSDI